MHDSHPTLFGPISALVALIILMMASTPVQGGEHDSIILLPRDSLPFTINKDALPREEGAIPEWVIVSWSDPTRGGLTETDTAFIYTPDEQFRIKGSDSFRYRFLSEHGLTTATVFLVADLGPGDDSGDPLGETTAGGDTVLVLDIGTRWAPAISNPEPQTRLSATRELLRAHDRANNVRFDLWLIDHFGGDLILQARAFENEHDVVMLPPAIIPEDSATIHLDWWASRSGARNGGLLVRHNDVLVSHVVGLDNVFHGGLAWALVEDAPPTLDAAVTMGPTHERTTAVPMAFPPGFADTFEDAGLEAWQPGHPTGHNDPLPSGVEVVTDAASDGELGLRVDLSAGAGGTLRNDSPPAVERYRARFDLRTDATCLGASDLQPEKQVVLLAGLDATTSRPLFELGIRLADEGAFHVTLRGVDDAGVWHAHTRPTSLPANATLDVEWWAAAQSPDAKGGLALRIDGAVSPWPSFSLSNGQQRIGGVLFGAVFSGSGSGAIGPDTGSSRLEGSICLDEFESWF